MVPKHSQRDSLQDIQEATLRHQRLLYNLGRAIRNARKQMHMTQEQLGELANINPKYLGEVESGKSNPSVTLLNKIAEALRLDLTDLLLASQEPIGSDISLYKRVLEVLQILKQPEMEKVKNLAKKLLE